MAAAETKTPANATTLNRRRFIPRFPSLSQYFLIMLPKLRRRTLDPHRCVGKPHAVPHQVDLAELRMRNAHAHCKCLDLRIGEYFGEVIKRARGHVLLGQSSQPMLAVLGGEYCAEQAVQ